MPWKRIVPNCQEKCSYCNNICGRRLEHSEHECQKCNYERHWSAEQQAAQPAPQQRKCAKCGHARDEHAMELVRYKFCGHELCPCEGYCAPRQCKCEREDCNLPAGHDGLHSCAEQQTVPEVQAPELRRDLEELAHSWEVSLDMGCAKELRALVEKHFHTAAAQPAPEELEVQPKTRVYRGDGAEMFPVIEPGTLPSGLEEELSAKFLRWFGEGPFRWGIPRADLLKELAAFIRQREAALVDRREQLDAQLFASEAAVRQAQGEIDELRAAQERTPLREALGALKQCRANRDGDCNWEGCPQKREYNISCPLLSHEERD